MRSQHSIFARLTVAALATVVGIGALCPTRASAQMASDIPPTGIQPAKRTGNTADLIPPELKDVTIDQKLSQQLPLDTVFRDEEGKAVKLGDFFNKPTRTGSGKRPVIISLVYYECPMLCTLVLNDLTRGINGIKTLSAGEEFEIVTVSFEPKETPALARGKKGGYIRAYNRPYAAEGWHFLTGTQESIDALTQAIGFHYKWDPKFNQYIHPSGLTIATPDGRISKYFFGIDYDLKDLRLSLQEAAGNQIGTVTDKILLYCFHYDPNTGKYSLLIMRFVQIGGILTMAAIGTSWFFLYRRERRNGPPPGGAKPSN